MDLRCPRCGAAVEAEIVDTTSYAVEITCTSKRACGAEWDADGFEKQPEPEPEPCEHEWLSLGPESKYLRCVHCGTVNQDRGDGTPVHVFRPGQGWFERT
ncbi:hypothetical protein [Kineosporia sp. NBRC 101731]|uniref:hypothetical protein n=1 Tax=Kineosporia sp. NBRC 101731 TaxID=3032199 RepID=UPI0024A02044|nr:hypothetical protein [Kineosporia sp. NBRC 101731]GLY32097.1 hypothetical protein Kisp02_54620 [Kineosporia sp. NBRC 101731]